MEKNKKIFITLFVIVIIAIIGCVLYFTVFIAPEGGLTPFSNEFMEGEFVGTVNVINESNKWAVPYKDPVHHIEYNMSTSKNSSFLVDLYKYQGMKGPEIRKYNGQEWNIYSAQGMTGNASSNSSNSSNIVNVFMCVADKDNQSYVIYVVFNGNSDVNASGSVYSEGFTKYIEPLLKSITLKHNNDAPKLNEILGIDETSFNQQATLLNQAINGNKTAIAALSGG